MSDTVQDQPEVVEAEQDVDPQDADAAEGGEDDGDDEGGKDQEEDED